MGKWGPNAFKRNDAVRAIQSARGAGIAPAMMEVVVAKDGWVIYRVYGEDVVPTPGIAKTAPSQEWQEKVDKLKKPK